MPSENPHHTLTPSLEQLELKEGKLVRVSLLLLTLLATGLAVSSWESLRTLPQRLEALPIGVVLLIGLFAAHAWGERVRIAELRGFVRDLQKRANFQPTQEELDQWMETLSESERWLHDFIDSLDDAIFALSLEGGIVGMNRRFREVVGQPFSELIGHRLDEFLDEPSRPVVERALPKLLESGTWSGTVRIRVKKTGAVRSLDCVFRATVREDRVMGITAMAREVGSVPKQLWVSGPGSVTGRVHSIRTD
ncbi:MAG: PAS domain S-box protein [Acidobacteria bacterium]|nr:PAS domain S-box protein [Acidobacteriota bacterium]